MLWECSDWRAVNTSGKKLITNEHTAITRPLNATCWKDTIKYYPSYFLPPPSSPFKIVSVTFKLHGLKTDSLCVDIKSSCVYHMSITTCAHSCGHETWFAAFVIVPLKITGHEWCKCCCQTKKPSALLFLVFAVLW